MIARTGRVSLAEFAEFVTFVPNSPEAASAYADTLFDLANGMIGGFIGAIVTSRLELVPSPAGPNPREPAGRPPE